MPLAPFTTLGVGGPARYLLRVDDLDTLRHGLEWARCQGLALFVLGGGSNVVVSDRGFDGLVLRIGLRGRRWAPDGTVTAAAGESWDELVEAAVQRCLAGIECLSGIPGLVGAAPIQNVGAYGQEIADTLVTVEALDRLTGELVRFDRDACRFSYRDSRFKRDREQRHVIVRVTLRLIPHGAATVAYDDVRRRLEADAVEQPDLEAVREAVLRVRRAKGMVLDPEDPDTRSDGSFFLNPYLEGDEVDRFLARAAGHDRDDIPIFRTSSGAKVSAAWLIEHAGFERGDRFGGVGLSNKHALAIVNRDGGTAREVRRLAARIQERVEELFGISLEPEPRFVGFTEDDAR